MFVFVVVLIMKGAESFMTIEEQCYRKWWEWDKYHFYFEVTWGRRASLAGVGITFNEEDANGLQFSLMLYRLICVFFSVSSPTIRKFMPSERRDIGVRFFDGGVWWEVWSKDEWNSRDPWWVRGVFRPVDFVFGRKRGGYVTLEERNTFLQMPEGKYPTKAKLELGTWKRKRWPWKPFTVQKTVAELEFLIPVPVPGKGESAWDLGDDAVCTCGVAAFSIEEALAKKVASITKDRRRWAGVNWVPDKGWPEGMITYEK